MVGWLGWVVNLTDLKRRLKLAGECPERIDSGPVMQGREGMLGAGARHPDEEEKGSLRESSVWIPASSFLL